jgi:hypothetical protein
MGMREHAFPLGPKCRCSCANSVPDSCTKLARFLHESCAVRARFVRESFSFRARILHKSCTIAARMRAEFVARFVALLHGSRRSLGAFPCYEDVIGGGPQRSRARQRRSEPLTARTAAVRALLQGKALRTSLVCLRAFIQSKHAGRG